jgi:hypothetical protein
MPLRYSCFISYCHGEGELMRRFIDDLTAALTAYLEPFLDETVYIDEQRLRPGYLYNEALATALCQSVCMVVVYVPKYERHNYCLREFEAMERIETRRKEAITRRDLRDKGMIIPIVLRGAPDVPDKIKRRFHFLDFSKYSTASPKISRNRKYAEEIDKIARYIYELYTELRNAGQDVCANCGEFALPPEQDVQPWKATPAEPRYPR